jgi:hypothetical protein
LRRSYPHGNRFARSLADVLPPFRLSPEKHLLPKR